MMRESGEAYDGTLEGFFGLLDRFWAAGEGRPRLVRRLAYPLAPGFQPPSPQAGLFAEENAGGALRNPPGLLPCPESLGGAPGILYQVSADAYGALVHAWMSCLPVEAQALRYALRVLSSAREAASGAAGGVPWYARAGAREGAALAALNRGDGDCLAVLAAACKAAREIDRLKGFLRFKPAAGFCLARCSPDHFVLPALEPHFTRRFGDTPWAVLDERRGLALASEGEARIVFAGEIQPGRDGAGDRAPLLYDSWEKLWRSYHRSVSIENRANPSLQRRFVPLRYREYLTEFGPG
jgi:hypothetical protein